MVESSYLKKSSPGKEVFTRQMHVLLPDNALEFAAWNQESKDYMKTQRQNP
jgi:hypothetical protein